MIVQPAVGAGLIRVLAGLRDGGGARGDQVEMRSARLFADTRKFRSGRAQLRLGVDDCGGKVGICQRRDDGVRVDDRAGSHRQRRHDAVVGRRHGEHAFRRKQSAGAYRAGEWPAHGDVGDDRIARDHRLRGGSMENRGQRPRRPAERGDQSDRCGNPRELRPERFIVDKEMFFADKETDERSPSSDDLRPERFIVDNARNELRPERLVVDDERNELRPERLVVDKEMFFADKETDERSPSSDELRPERFVVDKERDERRSGRDERRSDENEAPPFRDERRPETNEAPPVRDEQSPHGTTLPPGRAERSPSACRRRTFRDERRTSSCRRRTFPCRLRS